MKINIQFFGGRGSRSSGASGSVSESNNSYNNSYIPADNTTQSKHAEAVKTLGSPSYENGTYNLDTLTPVSYDSGYQVTFCQKGDNYSDAEYANKVNEFLAVSSDGKVLAGKFEDTPEISFHCNDRDTAIKLAKKYNQISVWDWGNCDEIKTGGTGERS